MSTRSTGSLPDPSSPAAPANAPPILALDTTSHAGAVALRWADGEIECTELGPPRGHARRIFSVIQELLAAREIGIGALGAIAVSTGPGSFTAVRLGLTAAKSIAETRKIPLIGVSNFEAAVHSAELPTEARACVLLPTARKETFVAVVSGSGRISGVPVVTSLARWQPPVDLPITHCLAPDAALLAELDALPALAPAQRVLIPPSSVDAVARIAHRRLLAEDVDDPLSLDAAYVRHEDADRSWVDPR